MAPTDQKMKSKKFTATDGNWKKSKNNTQGVKKKRKWVPESKIFEGNLKEGQGFAFKRKEKVKYEYNKLLRKEEKKKKNPETKTLYQDEYPEHLRHLYVAEAEKLKNEAWTNRMNRSKMRMKGHEKEDETGENDAAAHESEEHPDPDVTGESELTDSVSGKPEPTAASEKESLPMSNRMRKKMLKKTSYQKTKEEFESIQEKRRKKKEEYLKNKQQREEAVQKYKQKKMETFQMLSKKTKKGQPNLNLQMEYLLQKIQGPNK
ncbi:Thyroid transcription factor 1-associated protein 26-like protein [Larimichthys crocea]|uniref:Thyroid transcription factor 1-associated protein 26-like protein n=2 Tax=Larimichthys crocea TaxID=215358 RepID=A0A6G0HQA9_LARCR|nr:Thyroid transcription factor 1-associated protein 26-like protein [Larimichthys crocea]